MTQLHIEPQPRAPWDRGKLSGQKRPLKLQEIWAIRIRLQLQDRTRELALFNLAIDSKLRACDLMALTVADIAQGGLVQSRALVLQQKTGRPVQFEITNQTRQSLENWIAEQELQPPDYLFPSRVRRSSHLSRRQYARIVNHWVSEIGLDPSLYGTHSIRRKKAALIYRRTKPRSVTVQGHKKKEPRGFLSSRCGAPR
jgi:integrase